MARRVHQPRPETRERVRALARAGLADGKIARVCGIRPATLRRHYGAELEAGREAPRWHIAPGRSAMAARMFWLAARARWTASEPARADRTDRFGPGSVYDLSDAELIAILQEHKRTKC